jgi:hypothetical protein
MQRKFILLIPVALILIAATIGLLTRSNATGNVQISINTPDADNITATLNDESLKLKGLGGTYNLKPGTYNLKITKPGYKEFSTKFTIAKGSDISVNANMERKETTTAQGATNTLVSDLAASIGTFDIVTSQYFYTNTWAALVISQDGNNAYLIAHYSDVTNKWEAVVGPGTFLSSSDLDGVPTDVQNYMFNNNYASQE